MMRYFCSLSDRVGTCYYEFYIGKWDQKTFWKSDSIFLHDDILFELKIEDAFVAVLPDYDPFGVTEVNLPQWESILDYASQLDTQAITALTEAAAWVKNAFESHDVFTILGI